MNPQPAKKAPYRAYNAYNYADIIIGTKSGNVINVAVQLREARGQTPPAPVRARAYLTDVAAGTAITATAAGGLAIGTNGSILNQTVSNKSLEIITDSQGRFDINITQATSPLTYYLVLEMPDGSIQVSNAITF